LDLGLPSNFSSGAQETFAPSSPHGQEFLYFSFLTDARF